ncbi:putative cysteine protease [Cafeteria roenbergensis virus]|uniref:Putative cysteine protease n=1 Tax=Cafeteria roenbergensis virus (strain BV-PW1) TaxID=693272 RepID=E3T5Q6_CROVB|nr:putative cysteine protease [Cafeteria roenbergensis virus BV-PW1]ADO67519.1 putative cysteine protease [Cafeteria roenbergensis virus BV-PW1]
MASAFVDEGILRPNHVRIPLKDGLPYGSFAINVPDDGDCFFHAVLKYLQVSKIKLNGIDVSDMTIKDFKNHLLTIATDGTNSTEISPDVIKALTEKDCWAGEETIIFMVQYLGVNIDIYNIYGMPPININRYSFITNEHTIKLLYTGNHYMSYFLGDTGDISATAVELEFDTLTVDEILKMKFDEGSYVKDNKPPDIIETISGLAKMFKIVESDDIFMTLTKLKENKHLTEEQFNNLKKQLIDLLGSNKYYTKYLKYKSKYLLLKKQIYNKH